jgi:hypothetical protein
LQFRRLVNLIDVDIGFKFRFVHFVRALLAAITGKFFESII